MVHGVYAHHATTKLASYNMEYKQKCRRQTTLRCPRHSCYLRHCALAGATFTCKLDGQKPTHRANRPNGLIDYFS